MVKSKNKAPVRLGTIQETPAKDERSSIGPSLSWVRVRRVAAFLIDYLLYLVVALVLSSLFAILAEGMMSTLALYGSDSPPASSRAADTVYGFTRYLAGVLTLAAAFGYIAITLGGPRQGTWGMQLVNLCLQRLDGQPITPRYAVAHAIVFLALNAVLTPLILLAPLVLANKQTVHDRLLDTVMTNPD